MQPRTLRKQVRIVNQRGLHARAAARFVKLAAEFRSDITVEHGGMAVTGRSIMGLLMFGAARGEELGLTAAGPDAKAALDALARLVEEGFGET